MADNKVQKKAKKAKKEKEKKEKKRKRSEEASTSESSPSLMKKTDKQTETCVLPLLDPALSPSTNRSDSKVWLCRVPDAADFDVAKVVKFVEGLDPSEVEKIMSKGGGRPGSVVGVGEDIGGGDRMELRRGDLGEGGGVMRVLVPGGGEEMKLGRAFDGQMYLCITND